MFDCLILCVVCTQTTPSTSHLDAVGQLWLSVNHHIGAKFDTNASIHHGDDSEGHQTHFHLQQLTGERAAAEGDRCSASLNLHSGAKEPCQLCNTSKPNLKHILSDCTTTVSQGRYR
ncbi:hypothetical protein INR49_016658 [Caranx melampygus]|nr:hypothetical protein INR49_016658 [Caranx melampygus]